MDPLSLAIAAAAVAGASAAKHYRQPRLSGPASVVEFAVLRISDLFVTSLKGLQGSSPAMSGAELQKILEFNKKQQQPLEHEQVYELVIVLSNYLQTLTLKISAECTNNYKNAKKIRTTLYDYLHRKICQHSQVPKSAYEHLAFTVQKVVNELFRVIYNHLRKMRLKQRLRKYVVWKNKPRTMPTTSGTLVNPKDHIQKNTQNKDNP